MSTAIPNLWPSITTPDVVSPVAILKQQASLLRQNTQGILEGEVRQTSNTPSWSWWTFSIIATQLNRYRIEIFRIAFVKQYPYPVTIDAEDLQWELRQAELNWALQPVEQQAPEDDAFEVVASTQDEFLQILRVLLGSRKTRSVIESLLARSNEGEGVAAGEVSSPIVDSGSVSES